jgi:hypothetical protein
MAIGASTCLGTGCADIVGVNMARAKGVKRGQRAEGRAGVVSRDTKVNRRYFHLTDEP